MKIFLYIVGGLSNFILISSSISMTSIESAASAKPFGVSPVLAEWTDLRDSEKGVAERFAEIACDSYTLEQLANPWANGAFFRVFNQHMPSRVERDNVLHDKYMTYFMEKTVECYNKKEVQNESQNNSSLWKYNPETGGLEPPKK